VEFNIIHKDVGTWSTTNSKYIWPQQKLEVNENHMDHSSLTHISRFSEGRYG